MRQQRNQRSFKSTTMADALIVGMAKGIIDVQDADIEKKANAEVGAVLAEGNKRVFEQLGGDPCNAV